MQTAAEKGNQMRSKGSKEVVERIDTRVAQNARGVVNVVVKCVTRASFGCPALLTPQLKRASATHRDEKGFMGVYMIQQVHCGSVFHPKDGSDFDGL